MKKIFFIVFSLILMCSVSFAIEVNVDYYSDGSSMGSSTEPIPTFGDYTGSDIYNVLNGLTTDLSNSEYIENYNTLVNYLNISGYKYVTFKSSYRDMYYMIIGNNTYFSDFVSFNYNGYDHIAIFSNVTNTNYRNTGYLIGRSSYSDCDFRANSAYRISYVSDCFIENVYDSNCDIYQLALGSNGYYWDGSSYYYQLQQGGDSGENVPEITDEELSNIVSMFVNSDALSTNRLSGWNDFYITYNLLTDAYYAYVYDSGYPLMMRYGDFDEEDNFIYSGTEEGSYFETTLDCESLGLGEILDYFINFKIGKRVFQEYSIYPELNRVSYHQDLAVEQTYHNVENEVIVYTTKPIKLYTKDDTGSLVATENYIDKTILTDSETGEEIEITIPDETASNTVFSKIVSVIKGGFEGLLTGIKAIFIPSEDFLSDKANQVLDKITFYTNLQSTFDNLVASMTKDSEGAPQITVDFDLSENSIFYGVGSANVLDFSWYEPYKPVVDLFIIAFVYGVFIYRFIIELPNTISGLANAFEYEPTTVTDSKGEHFAMRERHTGKIRKGR